MIVGLLGDVHGHVFHALEVLRRWQADGTDEIQWITRHALRTLLKAGDSDALELLGFPSDPAIAVTNLAVKPKSIPMGGKVTFSFDIESLSEDRQKLMIDYVVHLMRKNGKRTPKVFKLSTRTLQPGEKLHLERTQSFKPITTRKYYPGEHAVQPKINGKLYETAEFVLSLG